MFVHQFEFFNVNSPVEKRDSPYIWSHFVWRLIQLMNLNKSHIWTNTRRLYQWLWYHITCNSGLYFCFMEHTERVAFTTAENFVMVKALFLHFSTTEVCWWGVYQDFWICGGCQVLAVKLLYILWSKWCSHQEGSEDRTSSGAETCFTSCVSTDISVSWGTPLRSCGHLVWFGAVLVCQWW